jgi:hypothetical protein
VNGIQRIEKAEYPCALTWQWQVLPPQPLLDLSTGHPDDVRNLL